MPGECPSERHSRRLVVDRYPGKAAGIGVLGFDGDAFVRMPCDQCLQRMSVCGDIRDWEAEMCRQCGDRDTATGNRLDI